MNRFPWIAVALLALALGACQPDAGEPAPPGDDGAPAESADPEVGDAFDSDDPQGAEDDPAEESADGGAAAEDAEAAGEEPAEDGGAAADVPTPDPTVVALAEAFQPPRLGNPDAPIVLYEFSDYL